MASTSTISVSFRMEDGANEMKTLVLNTKELHKFLVAGSKREGKEFGLTLMEFADAVTPDDMSEWSEAISASNVEDSTTGGAKKKKRRQESTNS